MKKKLASVLIGWIFSHMNALLPLKSAGQNWFWMACKHPKPSYPVHYVFIPKSAPASLVECPFDEPEFALALLTLVDQVIFEHDLGQRTCKLVFNAGQYQTFPIAHAHLISE